MKRMLRLTTTIGMLLAVAGAIGCSGGSGSNPGAQGGATATGGTAGSSVVGSGGTAADGSAGPSTGGSTTPTSGCGVGGSGGATSPYPNLGVKGERGQATADATTFDGWEETFIIGEEGYGTDVCAVRFDLKRVGEAPGGCSECLWTHLVEYSNPRVTTDIDGVCAKSDLALTSDVIAKKVGARVAVGFVKELGGAHGSARMKFFACMNTWDVSGNATWKEASKALTYIFRDGNCYYGP